MGEFCWRSDSFFTIVKKNQKLVKTTKIKKIIIIVGYVLLFFLLKK
jgi:hypothetical protein